MQQAQAFLAGPPPVRELGPGTSGQVSTLIVPADVSWSTGARHTAAVDTPAAARASDEAIAQAAVALRSGQHVALLLGGGALGEPALRAASRIARAAGARVLGELWPARRRKGAGVPAVELAVATPGPHLIEAVITLA